MPADFIKEFVDVYTLGDGSFRYKKGKLLEQMIFTTSPKMADDMQELAQKLGWHSALKWVGPFDSVIHENGSTRTIRNSGVFRVSFKRRAIRAELQPEAFKEIQYDGKIYCLNVPYHTLYIRRGGKPSWNGNTPSCVFTQLSPSGQLLIIDELVSDSMGVDQFSDEVLTHCSMKYPDYTFTDIGDPAGEQRAQTDEKTCFQILMSKGIYIEPGMQSMAIRLESVRRPLTSLRMGKPGLQVHPRCKVLRKGFMGGYQFRRLQTSQERFTATPDKNQYSHPHDALQYACTHFFGGGLTTPRQRQDDDYGDYEIDTTGMSGTTGY